MKRRRLGGRAGRGPLVIVSLIFFVRELSFLAQVENLNSRWSLFCTKM